jgi:hypothetical protein
MMTVIQSITAVWISMWLMCAMIYALSSAANAKKEGKRWSLKKFISVMPSLLVMWPLTVALYVHSRIKLNRRNTLCRK